ncbi:hypothetical protein AB0M54_47265 [Actinoplanes sp. NPDC051470]|uniref:hypothetical protein n=1 Tax=Actinoplanes sp. NPDC051470 TaxID=3157224 RepID=UPI0034489652
MTIILAIVGILIAAAALIFSGWQARLLARQTALQNATAGAATLQNLFNWLHSVQALLLKEPRLLPHFRDGEAIRPDLSEDEKSRMRLLASMYSDVLTIGVFLHTTIPQTQSGREWEEACVRMLRLSQPIRQEVSTKPTEYPDLAMLMRESIADDIEPHSRPNLDRDR